MKKKYEIKKTTEEDVKNALLKKALGYVAEEVVEEYIKDQDDNLILNKRKVTSKVVPADIPAVKVVLDLIKDDDFSSMSDEELMQEKDRLLELLNNYEEVNDDN